MPVAATAASINLRDATDFKMASVITILSFKQLFDMDMTGMRGEG
jgi:hypothetical protein